MAAYWRRNYRSQGENEGWYLLTNLGNLSKAITAFQSRSGIEAMFKDCKSGGDNLEKTHACPQRLINLILVIAFADTWAVIQSHRIKRMGLQQYVGRLKEFHRRFRRHSSFLVGLSGKTLPSLGKLIEETLLSQQDQKKVLYPRRKNQWL